MTQLLLRIFVKPAQDPKDPAFRSAVGKLSGVVGIVCNLLLFAAKLLAGLGAGSVSVMADAMNNLSDATSSIVTLLGFKLAEQPADDDHPYGHARYEYLAGLAVAVIIIVIGFELAKTAVQKILQPSSVDFSLLTAVILLLSVGVKLWMAVFNRKAGALIQSTALQAASVDSRNDCLATAAVLLAGVLERVTSWQVDGFIGLGVALFILRSGWLLAKETISPLLGETADPQLCAQIAEFIQSSPKVLGLHDLMVHDYGPRAALCLFARGNGSKGGSAGVPRDH